MKKYKLLCVALTAIITLSACSSNKESQNEITDGGNTYTQEVSFPQEATTRTVTLTKAWGSSQIENVNNNSSWLTVSFANAPQITISTMENTSSSSRTANVTIKAYQGDKILLKVTQNGTTNNEKTEIDDVHGTVSDQPAYAPKK